MREIGCLYNPMEWKGNCNINNQKVNYQQGSIVYCTHISLSATLEERRHYRYFCSSVKIFVDFYQNNASIFHRFGLISADSIILWGVPVSLNIA
jgi:hypothetical protein